MEHGKPLAIPETAALVVPGGDEEQELAISTEAPDNIKIASEASPAGVVLRYPVDGLSWPSVGVPPWSPTNRKPGHRKGRMQRCGLVPSRAMLRFKEKVISAVIASRPACGATATLTATRFLYGRSSSASTSRRQRSPAVTRRSTDGPGAYELSPG